MGCENHTTTQPDCHDCAMNQPAPCSDCGGLDDSACSCEVIAPEEFDGLLFTCNHCGAQSRDLRGLEHVDCAEDGSAEKHPAAVITRGPPLKFEACRHCGQEGPMGAGHCNVRDAVD